MHRSCNMRYLFRRLLACAAHRRLRCEPAPAFRRDRSELGCPITARIVQLCAFWIGLSFRWSRKVMLGANFSRTAGASKQAKMLGERVERGSHGPHAGVAKPLCERVIDRCE